MSKSPLFLQSFNSSVKEMIYFQIQNHFSNHDTLNLHHLSYTNLGKNFNNKWLTVVNQLDASISY